MAVKQLDMTEKRRRTLQKALALYRENLEAKRDGCRQRNMALAAEAFDEELKTLADMAKALGVKTTWN